MDNNVVYAFMQAINVLSLGLLLTPLTLRYLLGIPTQLSTEYDYLFSIEQFVPDLFVTLWFQNDKLAIQTLETNGGIVVYFPGVFIECFLGTFQGVLLGLDLLRSPTGGMYQTPALAGMNLLFYSGMCMAAMPLHCLKDIPMFDITTETMLTQGLFWFDTFCTSCVPPVMLLSGLIESGVLPRKRQQIVLLVAFVNGALTWIGVFRHQRWLMIFLHIFYQPIFLFPLIYITRQRVKRLGCPGHGYGFMVLAKVCSLVCAYSGFSFASVLSHMTEGAFCPLTSVFVGCRIGMVQYWVYCKRQAQCACTEKGKDA